EMPNAATRIPRPATNVLIEPLQRNCLLRALVPSWLLDFHDLDRNPIRALDHRGARAAPRVNLLEDLHVLALQPLDRRGQVGGADRPVIDQLAARADETAARPRPNRDRD